MNKQKSYPTFQTMNELIASDRVPISTKALLQHRINNYPNELKEIFHAQHTADIIAYHPDGRIKVVRNSQLIRENNKTVLHDTTPYYGVEQIFLLGGTLKESLENYESLDGQEFRRWDFWHMSFGKDGELSTGMISNYIREDVINHPIWLALVNGDKKQLEDYVDVIIALECVSRQREDPDSIAYINKNLRILMDVVIDGPNPTRMAYAKQWNITSTRESCAYGNETYISVRPIIGLLRDELDALEKRV